MGLGRELNVVLTWVLSVVALLAGLVAWRGSGWRSGWAPVVTLFGFEQLRGSMVFRAVVPGAHGWISFGTPLLGSLPVPVALGLGAHLAWSSVRGRSRARRAHGQGSVREGSPW